MKTKILNFLVEDRNARLSNVVIKLTGNARFFFSVWTLLIACGKKIKKNPNCLGIHRLKICFSEKYRKSTQQSAFMIYCQRWDYMSVSKAAGFFVEYGDKSRKREPHELHEKGNFWVLALGTNFRYCTWVNAEHPNTFDLALYSHKDESLAMFIWH